MKRIKVELISSCTNNNPESFLPFLMSEKVETETSIKMDFYDFFKDMLSDAHLRANGKLTVKIEESTDYTDKIVHNYNFFDNTHKHPLLSIEVKESNNLIYLDIMPF